jgi:hypothetical protein
MEPQFELQRLLRRQREIRHAMRQPGGARVTMERELYTILERLKDIPAAQPALQAESAHTISGRYIY